MERNRVRVGVLSLHSSKETKAILNAVEALGHTPVWLREENLVFHFADEGVDLRPDIDVVVNRLLLSKTDQPLEDHGVALTLEALRPTLNAPDSTIRATHKTAAAAALARAGIRTPETVFALGGDRLSEFRSDFGPDAVYKTAVGTNGGGAWRVEDRDVYTAKVGNRRAFLQRFIGTRDRPRDLRVYVVGDDVVGAMFRYAPEGDWRTNVALGGDVEDASDRVTDDLLAVARSATAALGLDYAGVDLIEGSDGWYVLEVNPTAGFKGLYRATGRSPAPHIARLAVERVGGDVDHARVSELAATLDDSEPSCAPTPLSHVPERPVVVGFTERIVVSGTTGTETVVGKADTGAERTSIDLRLAAEIGAGPIHTVSRVRSGSVKREKSRPVVDVVVGIGGTRHTVAANVVDRGHMTHPVLVGRDILRHYHLDVNRRVEATDHDEREE
ncbi:alpha-L-glutamate ligase, RimK family [Halogranum amylolyticum]|uniref:Alpha-L-glutamate ligase, RimK family n=1 Tax=Halogranum amylolyticum TaxID=660520 RepID=A0A1H8N2X9_9EURY|nr:RimK family alpha-L-glutamate ligase [Halogranum amylolyticum]SEO23995.1 alpha-L-glutamate ligase, RimK family [Halogranum amylolyticum]